MTEICFLKNLTILSPCLFSRSEVTAITSECSEIIKIIHCTVHTIKELNVPYLLVNTVSNVRIR